MSTTYNTNPKRKRGFLAFPRLRFGLVFGALLAALCTLLPSSAQETKPEGAAPLTELAVVEKVRAATDKALDYMEQKQDPQTGAWSGNHAINALANASICCSPPDSDALICS